MVKVYFTFGSSTRYPYTRGQYVVAEGRDRREAIKKFREKHPDRTPNVLNCADYYLEQQFNSFRDLYYKGVEPAEIIK